MRLQSILKVLSDRPRATIYADVPFEGGSHYIQLLRSNLREVLKREYEPDEETGKTLYYNDDHDSLYLTDNDKGDGKDGK